MFLIALFSQYLRNIEIPVFIVKRNQNRKLGCKKIQYPFFKMFPVWLREHNNKNTITFYLLTFMSVFDQKYGGDSCNQFSVEISVRSRRK